MSTNAAIVAWRPQPGPQTALLRCPAPDVFYGGSRGGGKTEAMLGEWIEHQRRYGRHANGIVFRRRRTQLIDLKRRAAQLFVPLGARYNGTEHVFTFRNGAVLRFAYLESDADAENYQGQSFSRVYVEELPNFPDPAPIDKLKATLRSAHDVPCRFRATGNPGGPGHLWVRGRYIDPAPEGYKPIMDDETGMHRLFIPAKVEDNPALLDSDPTYVMRLKGSGSPELVRAWLHGDWDVAIGAFFEGVWDPRRHVVQPFPVPAHWRQWRSLDWGYARPYAIYWWAMDGDGVVYCTRELYGYGGRPNVGARQDAAHVAATVAEMEAADVKAGVRFRHNPADADLFYKRGEARAMIDAFRAAGVQWSEAFKAPGSRVQGAQELIRRLNSDTLKIFSTCKHWLRTVPTLPADPRNPEDVDSDAEDHSFDASRYSLLQRRSKATPPPAEIPSDSKRTLDWTMDQMKPQPMMPIDHIADDLNA